MTTTHNVQYPSIAEYGEAMRHPDRCFRDPVLRACKAEVDGRGDPLPRTGGNAAVFKLVGPTGAVAVKVFKHREPERERRYKAVSDYLSALHSPHLVGFKYHDEGIRIPPAKVYYPILVMDWVSGDSLTDWVAACVRRHDTTALQDMARRWDALIRHLKEHHIAHGDLQHGNVLVG